MVEDRVFKLQLVLQLVLMSIIPTYGNDRIITILLLVGLRQEFYGYDKANAHSRPRHGRNNLME